MVNSPRCRGAEGEHQSWAWSAWGWGFLGAGRPGTGLVGTRSSATRGGELPVSRTLSASGRREGVRSPVCEVPLLLELNDRTAGWALQMVLAGNAHPPPPYGCNLAARF